MQIQLVVAVLALVLVNSVLSAPAVEQQMTSVSSSQSGGQTYTSGFAAASGPDGKVYYVKDVNGKIEKGVMEGPLPMPTLDLSGVFANAFRPLSFPFYPAYNIAPAENLNSEIRNAVNKYLQNLRI